MASRFRLPCVWPVREVIPSFLVDRTQMGVDGPWAQNQSLGDLAAVQSGSPSRTISFGGGRVRRTQPRVDVVGRSAALRQSGSIDRDRAAGDRPRRPRSRRDRPPPDRRLGRGRGSIPTRHSELQCRRCAAGGADPRPALRAADRKHVTRRYRHDAPRSFAQHRRPSGAGRRAKLNAWNAPLSSSWFACLSRFRIGSAHTIYVYVLGAVVEKPKRPVTAAVTRQLRCRTRLAPAF